MNALVVTFRSALIKLPPGPSPFIGSTVINASGSLEWSGYMKGDGCDNIWQFYRSNRI